MTVNRAWRDGGQPAVFIARASVQDGLGHLVRSLCVLQEAKNLFPVHLVVLGDGTGVHLIEEAAVPWSLCSSDAHAAQVALEKAAGLVVFDTLEFNGPVFDRIAAAAVTASLSPSFSQMVKVRHLFHRTAVDDPMWALEPMFPTVYKGLHYAVLPTWLKRVSVRHYREQLNQRRLAIAISMGGADAPNRTLSLLKLFGQRRSLKLVIWVALGDAYTHSYADLLHCAADNRQEIILLKSNDSMWHVLKNVSLVLCAGGLTTYEAAHMGLPTINLIQQPRWKFLFDELVDRGACFTIPPSADSLERAVRMVSALERNRKRLLSTHLASTNLVPGGGARRIARKLHAIRNGHAQ